MDFDRAVEIILDKEKGYIFDKRDMGGETNWGICKKSYPNLDIKNLTQADAKKIYHDDFWDKCDIHLLPPGLNLLVFDCAVNQGQPTSIIILKAVLGRPRGTKLDIADLEEIEEMGVKAVMGKYIDARKERYRISKTVKIHGFGWLCRLIEVSIIAFMETK